MPLLFGLGSWTAVLAQIFPQRSLGQPPITADLDALQFAFNEKASNPSRGESADDTSFRHGDGFGRQIFQAISFRISAGHDQSFRLLK